MVSAADTSCWRTCEGSTSSSDTAWYNKCRVTCRCRQFDECDCDSDLDCKNKKKVGCVIMCKNKRAGETYPN